MKIRGSHLIALAIMGAIGGWMFTGDLILGGQADPNAVSIAEREEKRSNDAFRVRVTTVQPDERSEVLSVRGRTEADNRISVRAETAGRVDRVEVVKGQRVAAGDLLCVIDLGIRDTSMAQAETALEQSLLERGFTTRARVRQLQTALDAAKAQVAASKQDMSRTEVRTTVGGQIAEPLADVGDNLAPAGICATVVQLDPLKFTGQVSEQSIGAIQPGMTADVALVDGRKVNGEVTFIAPTADAQTRTFAVEITLPNEDGAIREGLTASAAIPLNSTQAFQLVPSWLTLSDDGEVGVRVVQADETVAFKPVDIVAQDASMVWVNGLDAGDRVITLGQNYVAAGQAVVAVPDDKTDVSTDKTAALDG